MNRLIICAVMVLASVACNAIGTMYVTLSYKWDGVAKQDTLVLGVGGKQKPDYDNTGASASYTIGTWDYSFNSAAGLDLRFGISPGHSGFTVGRQEGARSCYKYLRSGSSERWMKFGRAYELDISRDYSITNRLTDVIITTTPYYGKKITNMTGGDIKLGLGWRGDPQTVVPNNSAVIDPNVITTFAYANYGTTWEAHSEQDWSEKFTPFAYSTIRMELPQLANIVLYKPQKPAVHELVGALVFGDMSASSNSNILYGASGYPLYSINSIWDSIGSAKIWTEWVFEQNEIPDPTAYINDVEKCPGHSTGHIIDYHVASSDNWKYDAANNTITITFTMRLNGESEVSSPSVVQRCWLSAYDTYDNAPDGARASISGVLGDTATFRITQNLITGAETLTVAN